MNDAPQSRPDKIKARSQPKPRDPKTSYRIGGLTLRTLKYVRAMWASMPAWLTSMEQARYFAINSIIVIGVLLGAGIVLSATIKSIHLIGPIHIPEELTKRGYTSDIVAQRILDEIVAIGNATRSLKQPSVFSSIAPDRNLPKVDLPVGGMSLASVVSALREFVGAKDVKIEGEITIEGEPATPATGPIAATATSEKKPQRYLLRLRISDRGALLHEMEPSERLDQLFERAALKLVERFDPFIAAAYYHTRGDDRNTQRMIERALQNDVGDDDPWALNLRGLLAEKEYPPEVAIAEFQWIIDHHPKFSSGYLNLANMLQAQGKYDKAYAHAKTAIRLAPDYPTGHNVAGFALMLQERFDEALWHFTQATKIDPKYAMGYFNAGSVYRRRPNAAPEAAINMFRRATDVDPDLSIAFMARGELSHELGRTSEARAAFAKAIEKSGQDANANNDVGVFYLKRHEADLARPYFERALVLDPHHTDARQNLSRTLGP